jgi:hypothetical protein
MANKNKENDPNRKQGQQGGQPHQPGHQKERIGESGNERGRGTVEEDLGTLQSEGNLGNEKTRNRGDEGVRTSRKDMHDSSRLPD